MSSSTRRKLKSAIICEHALDHLSDESSARTRPLSYAEIMLKRKSRKEVDAPGEEANETETTRIKEIVRNCDLHSRDTNRTALESSRDFEWEASPRKVEKSTRKVQTHIKCDTRDSERVANPRKKVEKSIRKEHTHVNSDICDSLQESSPRKKVEKSTKSEHTRIKIGTRDSQQESIPRNKVEKSTPTEHTHIKSNTRDPQHKFSSGKKLEKSSRTEHTHSKNDLQDSQWEASPRKVEKRFRMEHSHGKSDFRGVSSRKMEKSGRMEHTHSKSENKERCYVESRSKHKTDNDVRNATESKNDRQDRLGSKTEEHSRRHGRYSHENKLHRDSIVQDRYIERNGGAAEERKRRDRSGDDEKYRMRDPVKKHDVGSRHNFEILERKEKVDLSRSHRDEIRSKRRRSRSQEHSKEKARRSRSTSPKAQKNGFDHVHDLNELSLRSERDRFRRHSDVDQGKMSSDGFSSHHRRHGGSSSGLGGYSPRKRKSEAAVKTPSPIHSPERKNAGFDCRPGADGNLSTVVSPGTKMVSQIKSSNMTEFAAGFSVASSMGKPISAILSNSLSACKEASIDSVQLTQATRPMRRLYIDNIPGSATEKDIIECFNSFLLSSGSNYIRGTLPCISCMIHKEKGQALVEFLTPEDASAALSFDGRSLSGSILKIRRPKDYVEVPSGSSEKSKAGADSIRVDSISEVAIHSISDYVEDSPHKIFIGGIAEGISSEMIMEIVSAFGKLKAYRFVVNGDLKEPCAYLEFADQSVTLKACAGLNGMRLGGRVLTVAQAVPNTELMESSGFPPFYGIPEHVKPLLEMPTQVLKLSNALDPKTMDSLSETDLEEIVEDVRLECSRFGSVVSINFVKGGNMHIPLAETKEVTNDVKHIQPPEERNHLLNENPKEIALDHDDNNMEPPTSSKEFNVTDVIEGDKLELVSGTNNPDNELGASGISNVEESEEAGYLPRGSEDVSDNDSQEAAVIGISTIHYTGTVNGSEGNHPEASNGSMDIEKSNDSETLQAEGVSELDKNSKTLEEAVPLPANLGVAEGLNTVNSYDDGSMFKVGCILVQFKRTEASCMAAHCLHGRAFDERIVTVDYISLNAYQERFPKL